MIHNRTRSKPIIAFRCDAGQKVGYGHIYRCMYIAHALKQPTVFITHKNQETIDFLHKHIRLPHWSIRTITHDNDIFNKIEDISILVYDIRIDKHFHPVSVLKRVCNKLPVVILDYNRHDQTPPGLIINSLPTTKSIIIDNNESYCYTGYDYLLLPPDIQSKRFVSGKKKTGTLLNIAISFGGADPKNTTQYLIRYFNSLNDQYHLHIFLGPGYRERLQMTGCKHPFTIYRSPTNYYALLSTMDIVFTSFGITVFDAMRSGVPIALINNTRYHMELSRPLEKAGALIILGRRRITRHHQCVSLLHSKKKRNDISRIGTSIIDGNGITRVVHVIKQYASVIQKPTVIPSQQQCPICGSKRLEFLINQFHRKYIWCHHCQLKYQLIADIPDISKIYTNTYFTKQYKEHYGKTYQQDAPAIRKNAKKRLAIINRLHPEKGTMIDIGCAYGYFLDEARKQKWTVQGVEIIADAVRAAKKLGIHVQKKPIHEVTFKAESIDVITLWFTAEHLANMPEELSRITTWLKRKGILALSIPYAQGLTFLYNRQQWIAQQPYDHYWDLSINAAQRILKPNHMKLVRVNSTGIHYERARAIFNRKNDNHARHAQRYIKKARRRLLGDTIELYFQKVQ